MSDTELVRRGGGILIYQTVGGQTNLLMRLEGQTLRLPCALGYMRIAMAFGFAEKPCHPVCIMPPCLPGVIRIRINR